jgi:Chromo (CHRromatin Organisation MOdifier) domain
LKNRVTSAATIQMVRRGADEESGSNGDDREAITASESESEQHSGDGESGETPDAEDPDTEWEVRDILKERVTAKGEKEYKVLWVDDDVTTWEPKRNLRGATALLANFQRRQHAGTRGEGLRDVSRRSWARPGEGIEGRKKKGTKGKSSFAASKFGKKGRRAPSGGSSETPKRRGRPSVRGGESEAQPKRRRAAAALVQPTNVNLDQRFPEAREAHIKLITEAILAATGKANSAEIAAITERKRFEKSGGAYDVYCGLIEEALAKLAKKRRVLVSAATAISDSEEDEEAEPISAITPPRIAERANLWFSPLELASAHSDFSEELASLTKAGYGVQLVPTAQLSATGHPASFADVLANLG